MPNSIAHVYFFRLMFAVTLVTVLVLGTLPMGHSLILNVNDKLGHFMAFYACALLIDFSFPYSRFGLKKVLPLLGYGLLIEIIQLYLSYRYFSLYDLLADAAGLLAYGLSIPLIRHLPLLKGRWENGTLLVPNEHVE
ncbi:MAG: VanZ family protein [Pseudomonadota bacterium]